MSLIATVIQRGLVKKTLPLSVILGDTLRYGSLDDCFRLKRDRIESNCFVVYQPEEIGRGFLVSWNSQKTDQVELELSFPSSQNDILSFVASVKRITSFWKSTLLIDGKPADPTKWTEEEPRKLLDFNAEDLKKMCRAVLAKSIPQQSGDSFPIRTSIVFGAYWPLSIGVEEAERFLENPELFGPWLHEKQSIDVYYAAPRCYRRKDGSETIGAYSFPEDCRSVFPTSPDVFTRLSDPRNKNSVVCDRFWVYLNDFSKEGSAGRLPYELFLERLPKDKVSRFDDTHILIEALNAAEMERMMEP